ncbi:hypothetical protein ACVXZ4_16945 [Lacisediminihabitans sp. FW035]
MYLRDLAASLLRRWPVVLVGLLVTAGMCVGLAYVVPASYVARTSMVLLPPSTVVGAGGNPYLYLGGLGQALDVLTRKLNADEISLPIKKSYPDTEFTVSGDSSTTGPIIIVEASAPTAATARAVMNAVVDAAEPAMDSLQSGLDVPDKARITVSAFAVDQAPTPDLKTRIQVVGAVGALGLILTLLTAAFVDGRILARRQNGGTGPKSPDVEAAPAVRRKPGASRSPGQNSSPKVTTGARD